MRSAVIMLIMISLIGQNTDEDTIIDMLEDEDAKINFTMFLTLFGEKLNGEMLYFAAVIFLVLFICTLCNW